MEFRRVLFRSRLLPAADTVSGGPDATTGGLPEARVASSASRGNLSAPRRRKSGRVVPGHPGMPSRVRTTHRTSRPAHAHRWPTLDRPEPSQSAAWCGTPRRRGCSFFPALLVRGPLLGQVNFAVEQTLKSRGRVTQMHTDHTVLDLAATAQPLPRGADRLVAALGRPRFIDASDRFRMPVFSCHQLLALFPHSLLSIKDLIFTR